MSQKNNQMEQQSSNKKIVSQQTQVQTFRSGPLPPADELIRYNEATPDASDRIIRMSEQQQQHRFSLEKYVIENQLKESSRGQIFGFILALIGLLGSIFTIYSGKEIGGSILGGGSLTVLVSLFIMGKKEQRKSLDLKKQNKNIE
jgi:uncharacterized membrane protein